MSDSRLPELLIAQRVVQVALDPEHNARVAEVERKLAAMERGELSAEEAFGPPISAEDLQRRFFDDVHPQPPRRYKLPPHLHWMGEGDHAE